MIAPFNKGDRVSVGSFAGLVVDQCWRSFGDWRVLAYGPPTASNPKGRYTFSAKDAQFAEVQS